MGFTHWHHGRLHQLWLSLLLDVDDIDRLVECEGAGGHGQELAMRRSRLLNSLVDALQLRHSGCSPIQSGDPISPDSDLMAAAKDFEALCQC